ncbi:MAG: HAMP domain-containing sensor histidine kinase [Opitutaceae bacterium]
MPKVTYPLSLKVSLWLAANLLLLAILGAVFFVSQGGVGWSALVAGPSGDRVQALFNVIAGEAAAASPGPARDAVLTRFGAAYGAQFSLHGPGEVGVAGHRTPLPPALRERLEFRGPPRPFFGGRTRDRGEQPEPHEPTDARTAPRPRPGGEGAFRSEGAPFRIAELSPFRFISRTEDPPAYWLGLRVNYAPADRERPGRPPFAILLARLDTLPGLLHLLGLQSWLLGVGAVLALSIVFWLPLVRSITRSLRDLTAATSRIAEGRLDTRVDTRRRDELGHLGESVNRMAARLEAQQHGQKRFLGDVAHELCSPLARLQLATGILAEQAPPGLRDTVGDVREEVQQVSTLVNELLAFTKAGLQSRAVTLGPVAVEPLVQEVAAREIPGHPLRLAFPPELRVAADADLLRRALANLLRNAARYGGVGTPITLTGAAAAGRVTLTVDDEGPGVPPADLDRLGEPFFRPELARTREGGGVGLGLAIVRASVTACGGEVRFANRTPRGFRAELTLTAA